MTAERGAVAPHMARAWVNAFRRAERMEMARRLRELGTVRFYAVQPHGGLRAQADWLRDARWRVYGARRDAAAGAFGVSVSLAGLRWIVWRDADARAACLVGMLTWTPESTGVS